MNKTHNTNDPFALRPLVVLLRAMLRTSNSPFWRRYDEQH